MMNWISSIDSVSKLLNWVGVFAATATCLSVALKFRLDALKKAADSVKAIERKATDDELRQRAFDAENRASEADKRALALEQRNAPRDLSHDFIGHLSSLLAGYKPIGEIQLYFLANDAEARHLAEQLEKVFSDAGVSIRAGGFMSPDITPGISLIVRPPMDHRFETMMVSLFQSFGLPATATNYADDSPVEWTIHVGPKN